MARAMANDREDDGNNFGGMVRFAGRPKSGDNGDWDG